MTCPTSLPLPGVRSRCKSGCMSRSAWWPPRRNTRTRDLEKLYAWFERLDAGCTLGQVLQAAEQIAEGDAWQWDVAEERLREEGVATNSSRYSGALRQAARRAALAARHELQQISLLTGLCRRFSAMDFRFLFHPQRKLLAVGFNVSRSPLRRKLLRLAGLGSPPDQLPGRQSWPASAGALVCPGPDGYRGERHSHALELVGLDVRVPVADADHAFLSGHAAWTRLAVRR